MKPETVGMSSARLARLDEVMKRRYVDGGCLPGLLTYVYRKGHLVHTGISGQMDLERGKPMREDAIFRIYSMSKPITSVAALQLLADLPEELLVVVDLLGVPHARARVGLLEVLQHRLVDVERPVREVQRTVRTGVPVDPAATARAHRPDPAPDLPTHRGDVAHDPATRPHGWQRADRRCVESRLPGLRGDAFADDGLSRVAQTVPVRPGHHRAAVAPHGQRLTSVDGPRAGDRDRPDPEFRVAVAAGHSGCRGGGDRTLEQRAR